MIYFNRSFFRIFDSFLIPPLMGFFAKQFVLYSAIQSGYYFMSIVGIIVSVISASYYLKVIKILHSSELAENSALENKTTDNTTNGLLSIKISNFHSFLISGLTITIIIFILKPSILLNSTQLLSLSLFYY